MQLKPREIWDKATPLNDAWRVFSDSKLRRQYDDTFGVNQVQPIDFDKGFWEKAEAVIGALNVVIQAPKARLKAMEKMRADLIASLNSGVLLAIGFPTWPSEARIPRRIQA